MQEQTMRVRWGRHELAVVGLVVCLPSPEGVTIELRGAASQEAAVRMERLDFRTVAPAETRDWYVKTFGAGAAA